MPPAPGSRDMFSHPFMRNAFLAGTAIAAASGLVGYFVVLRSQVFSADALSHVAFTGALAALAIGIDARVGLFGATVLVALGLGLLGNRGRADDVVIGIGLHVGPRRSACSSSASTRGRRARRTAPRASTCCSARSSGSVAARRSPRPRSASGCCLAVLGIARPLLFASLDEAVAAARGVPVRALGVAFLVLVGVCAAEATQAVGALLLVGPDRRARGRGAARDHPAVGRAGGRGARSRSRRCGSA